MLQKKLMTQQIDFSNLLDVKGVDGFLVLDLNFEVIQSQLPMELNLQALLKSSIQFINSRKILGSLEQDIFLTEKGVIAISKIQDFYLVIIAGYQGSVDVVKLADFIKQLKMSLSLE